MNDPQPDPSSADAGAKVGRRLSGSTAPEVCDLIYTPRLAREFTQNFAHLTDIHQAHLLMLHKGDLIGTPQARNIAAALLRIEAEGPQAIALDPMREDAFFNYEAHLIAMAGQDGGRLHMGRSRNDILATQDRLRSRDLLIALMDLLLDVQETALEGAARHADAVMPGYTHLQPAQPITFGFYLAGVAQALARDADRLGRSYAETNSNPLGAGALAGTAFGIDRDETARLLGFTRVVPHALDAVASRDFALEILSALTITAITWSRVAQDLHVWSTHEFGLIDFPDSVAGTSSIMPQKKNPVVLEHLRGKAAHLIGLFTAAAVTVKSAHFSHAGDSSRESMRSFWEAAEECRSDLRLLDLVLRSAQPNRARMLRRAQEDFSCVTDLADAIVRTTALSFREAHHIVGSVVRSALEQGLPASRITTAMIDAASQTEIGRPLGLAESLVAVSLDPRACVESRNVPGGPSSESLSRMVSASTVRLEQMRVANTARRRAVEEARKVLKREMAALASR
jgi:argininosuccinate lyase